MREEKAPFALPPPNGDQRRVFAYLRKRGISSQVINGFIQSGLLYEDAEHHNCVFVGRNKEGVPMFANKRGTTSSQAPYPSLSDKRAVRKLTHSAAPPFPAAIASLDCGGSPPRNGSGFKGDVTGSDKSVGFHLYPDPTKETVYVFEAPIDLMSYCTLHRDVTHNAVALCGLHDGALYTYLLENVHLLRICLCLDADGPGQEAARQIKEKYQAMGFTVEIQTPERGKDWNEYLQQRIQGRERRR